MKRSLVIAALIAACACSAAPRPLAAAEATVARLYFLDIRGGRVVSTTPEGTDLKVLVTGLKGIPDGIVIDEEGGQIYWTHMGGAMEDDGYIRAAGLDGSGMKTIVPAGGTFTPKQLKLVKAQGKLYWSDREGMRIMRANLDGSAIETLIETGRGESDRWDAANWCVGIAVDPVAGKIYWTQKGPEYQDRGSIRRANIDVPKGQTAANRKDIEILFDALPEPIDLDLDLDAHRIYWTDRGDAPRGNTVNRAPMEPPSGVDPKRRQDIQILTGGLAEGIGIALDVPGDRMYFTDLGGSVYSARLDGTNRKTLLSGQGTLTGIAFGRLPASSPVRVPTSRQ
jgi:sugar lactone lactonase YvrE